MEQTTWTLLIVFTLACTRASDEEAGLQAHNSFRKIHDAEPLKLNSEMSAGAKSYAKKIAELGQLKHSSSDDGENLAYRCSQEDYTTKDATKVWYEEVCKPGYTFSSSSGFSMGTGHFTQVVWKGTKELGIGSHSIKKGDNTCVYVVGRYRPPGNMQGKFQENVVKGSFTENMCSKLDSLMNNGGDNTGGGDSGDVGGGAGTGGGDTGAGGGDTGAGGGNTGAGGGDIGAGGGDTGAGGSDTGAGGGDTGAGGGDTGAGGSDTGAGGSDTGAGGGDTGAGGGDTAVGGGDTSAGGGDTSVEGEDKKVGGEDSSEGDVIKNIPKAAKTIAIAAAAGAKAGGIAGAKAGAKSGKEAAIQAGASAGAPPAQEPKQKHLMGRRKKPHKIAAGVKIIPDNVGPYYASQPDVVTSGSTTGRDKTKDMTSAWKNAGETAGEKAGTEAGAKAGKDAAEKAEQDGGGKNSFEDAGLKAHNVFRKIHGVPEMTLDKQMSAEAKSYAQKLADLGRLEHSKDRNNAGENLASACSSEDTEMSAEEATRNWYAEVCTPGHDFNTDGDGSSGTGHFTQVIWKTSTKLGIGMGKGSKNEMFCTYVVGRYRDAGNFIGKYKENVPKGEFTPEVCSKLDDLIKGLSNGGAGAGGNEGGGAVTGGNEGGSAGTSGNEGGGAGAGGNEGGGAGADGNKGGGAGAGGNNESGGGEGGSEGGGGGEGGNKGNGGTGGNEEVLLEQAKEAAGKAGADAGKKAGERIGAELLKASSGNSEVTPSARMKTNIHRTEIVPSAKDAMFDSVKQLRRNRTVMVYKRTGVGSKSPLAAAQHAGAVAGAEAGAKAGAVAAAKLAKEQVLKNPDNGGSNDAEPGPSNPLGTAKPGKGSSGDSDPSPSGAQPGEGAQKGGGDTKPALGEGSPTGGGQQGGGDSDAAPGEGSPGSTGSKPRAGGKDESNAGDDSGGGANNGGDQGNNPIPGDNLPSKNPSGAGGEGNQKVSDEELENACSLAAKEGAEAGGRAGSEAAVDVVRPGSRRDLQRFTLFGTGPAASQSELSMTPGLNNPSVNPTQSYSGDENNQSDLTKRASKLGAKIGAEKGALAAAAAVVDAVGGNEKKKAKVLEKAEQIGEKIAQESSENASGGGGGKQGGDVGGDAGGGKNGGGDAGGGGTGSDNTGNNKEGGGEEPTSAAAQSGPSVSSTEFAKNGLAAHNIFRKLHGTPPLKLNDEMSKSAEEYAKRLVDLGRLKHSSREERDNAGENLAYSCTSGSDEFQAEQATHNWYAEVCKPGYTFGSNSPAGGVLHFTQVVWKGSTELGMGKAVGKKDGMTCTYVVGRYKVAGNMGGQYKNNVPQGDFTTAKCNSLKEMIQGISGGGGGGSKQGGDVGGGAGGGKNGGGDAGGGGTGSDNTGNNKEGGGEEPTSAADQSGPSVSSTEFAKNGLAAHNIFRKLHGTPPLKLNDEMSKSAEEYAKRLVDLGRLKHSSREERDNAGENLAYSCTSGSDEFQAEQATHNWYAEVCKPGYTFGSNSPAGGVLHFTQVVWKGSTELGMGKAVGKKDGMTCTYVVGRYKVAGNMGGQYKNNVPQGDFTTAKCNSLKEMIQGISGGVGGGSKQGGEGGGGAGSENTGDVGGGNIGGGGGGELASADEQSSPTVSNTEFAQKGLAAHNIFRKLHGTPPLKLNDEMSKSADEYAKRLVDLGRLEHSSRKERDNAGENLAYSCTSGTDEFKAEQATHDWYAEVCDPGYTFGTNNPTGAVLHFTQVVWKTSTELGMGKAVGRKDGMTCTYVVGRYKVAGNMGGQYKNNVPQGDFTTANCNSLEEMIQGISGDGGGGSKQGGEVGGGAGSENTGDVGEDNNKGGGGGEPELADDQGGPSVSSTEFARNGLAAHNIFRKLHGTPPLKLNDEMSKSADEYAKRLVDLGRLEHSSQKERDNAGENLAYSCTSGTDEFKAEQATHDWYAEVCDPGYTFGTNNPAGAVLHFTQVVWKTSTELGMGKAVGRKDGMICTYVVGRYKVAGNMGGQYKNNVPQGDFTTANCNSLEEMIQGISGGGGGAFKSSEIHGTVSTADHSFMEQALAAHNDYREIHQVSFLRPDEQLNREAQQFAEELSRRGKLEHASGIKDGENLAMKCLAPQEKEPNGSYFTTLWYDEVCNPGYNFNTEKFDRATGHFTQIAWDGSKYFGIGRAKSKIEGTNCVYVVARYRPAGNYEGDFLRNVKKGYYNPVICKTLMKRHFTPRYFKHRMRSARHGTWVL